MEFQTLQQQLETIFSCITITDEEKKIMIKAYLNPGMSRKECSVANGHIESALQDLSNKGLVFLDTSGKTNRIYPIPFALLIKHCQESLDKECMAKIQSTISNVDKWIKYPLMRINNTKIKYSEDNAVLMQWLFDLHSSDWEKVFCFGDYESFIDTIGIDTETDWIKERIKKGRKAKVVATQDGKWARHIKDFSQQQLRDCAITPSDFTDLFIMAFPEINTTVMGSSNNDVTFVHSKVIAHHYGSVVDEAINKS